jgi:hypothetical protein
LTRACPERDQSLDQSPVSCRSHSSIFSNNNRSNCI